MKHVIDESNKDTRLQTPEYFRPDSTIANHRQQNVFSNLACCQKCVDLSYKSLYLALQQRECINEFIQKCVLVSKTLHKEKYYISHDASVLNTKIFDGGKPGYTIREIHYSIHSAI